MEKLIIDGFIATQYYRANGHDEPVDVIEFNLAFAINPFYNSGSPAARHGTADLIITPKGRADVDYSCKFVDALIDADRVMVTDRIAFYSLMRAYLPSFILVDNNGQEYKVNSFATFYNDGFFSVTNIYSGLSMSFDDAHLRKIYNWEDIAYIKLDKLATEILKLDFPKEVVDHWDELKEIGIPIEEFFKLFQGDTFAIGKETVCRVLDENIEHSEGGNWYRGADVRKYRIPYSYLILRCNCPIKKVSAVYISNVLSTRNNDEFVNEQICDMGINLTAAPDTLMYGHRRFMYTVHKSECASDPIVLFLMFSIFDACLVEKLKYVNAIKAIRDIVYHPKDIVTDINKLLDVRRHQLTTVNDGYVYEYRDELILTVKAILNCIGIEDYKNEYQYFCQVAEELIVKDNELRHQHENSRQTKVLSILTLILTIPAVMNLVDLFYGLEINPVVFCPPNIAKLLWCVTVLATSLGFTYKNLIKEKTLNFYYSKIKKEK